MISADMVVDEARSWVGVPFLHQGRSRSGVDCVGLILQVLQDLGCITDDFKRPSYGRLPNQGHLERQISEYCLPLDQLIPGALIGVQWHGDAAHVAIYTGDNIIHAYEKRKQVVEHGFRGKWLERIKGVWALPGVYY